MTEYIIVGNGVAANTAADIIRKNDASATVRMFSRQEHHFYYTPALPAYLAGERDVAGVTIHDEGWYVDNNIALHLRSEIVAADTTASGRRPCSRAGLPAMP